MSPGDGTNVSGSSALTRHSIEWPVKVTSLCLNPEPLAGGDPDLFLHDVDAGHHLGDRMLDLQPGVRFHEIEAAVGIHQELEGAGVGVLHRLRRVDDDAAHLAAHLLGERRRRRLLDQLLMAALNRALALAEVHDRPVLIAEDLELDVARRLDVLLDVDVADAERRLGLPLRGLDRVRQLRRRPARRACRVRRRRRSP